MNNFIKRTDLLVDLNQVQNDLQTLISINGWPDKNQLGLRHRLNATDIWTDAHGSLYDHMNKVFKDSETSFTEWNPYVPEYLKNVIEQAAKQYNFKCGRIRILRLMPNRGMSVHADTEERFHLVIKTNPHAYMFKVDKETNVPIGQHIPADGYFYKVDTTLDHFVFNGGKEERIHLVLNTIY
jgi:hypothetical protein